ncbi:hypothetical protein Mapa_015731 [Marchantia paleacea]|nr:hypothetical protein Mapa_015731 [Marchantia paleacea]
MQLNMLKSSHYERSETEEINLEMFTVRWFSSYGSEFAPSLHFLESVAGSRGKSQDVGAWFLQLETFVSR